MQLSASARCAPIALVLMAALALAGCAKNTADEAADLAGAGGAGGAGGRGGVSRSGVGAPGSPQDFANNIGDRVFFDSDSTDLTAQAQATLDRQAEWLNRYRTYSFTIEGHADERGTREYNFALGARRAEAAKSYLISRGVAASRIRTVSFGKERPVAVCDDISCWSQNRRAVTLLPGGNS
ncbi:peptidoglycan-associated lipoprotein Pal [Methylocystis echinoides]|uniref:Peptidoglycan-associated protein n=1 Tax=Methylocystis echinoides TaxID=29468 RepID=A0A9W6LRZ0_9HYPH|nr:peptidoglycan-associated lipoprotein Pal [Methylocystis echinoides]GLI92947.1 outer membrane lipoprotein Omp16 [Methylocystis echinoides]